MPAAKKSAPKSASAPATVKPTVEKEKKVKAKAAEPKTTTKSQQSATSTPVVETAETSAVANVADDFTQFINKFQAMISQFSALKAELRVIEKRTAKELKVAQKLTNKKKRKGTRAPSGFVKPAPISNELADFLGLNHGSEMARTDVTREINKYIREHSLQDSNNGRKINPDKKLSTLLNVTPDIELTYFNLQKYMGPHFPKKTVEAASSS